MNLTLAKNLYEKNLLNQGSTILAKYTAIDVVGKRSFETTDEFLVIFCSNQPNELIIHCAHKKTGVRKNLTHNEILEIDGMTPERLAGSWDLDENGEKLDLGKRRGRKTNAEREFIKLQKELANNSQ